MRVKDAAEALLASIMTHIGHYPQPTAPESVSSLLDEASMLKLCNKENSTPLRAFKYFILDGCVLMSLLEQPLGNDEDPLPTLSAIFRGTYGRFAWTLQLRHVPKNKEVIVKLIIKHKKIIHINHSTPILSFRIFRIVQRLNKLIDQNRWL